jgi:AmmeMemoRadiSam system protein A
MLSEPARKTLLGIARQAVAAAVRAEPAVPPQVSDPELSAAQGAFVTLKTHGRLRGCIGQFIAQKPLFQVVHEMAVAAATEDPRFFGMRLRPQEMDVLEIEVSVLSPLSPVKDPMAEVELGTHGIYIRRGYRSGCFLPQVATETGWSKEEFLCQCCAGKAGLPPYAWKDPQTEVLVFTAEIIEEQ